MRGSDITPKYEVGVGHSSLTRALALNNAAVPAVNELTLDELRWFTETAPFFRIIGDTPDALMVGLAEGSTYESANYRWLSAQYESFAYIDRIVIAPSARRTTKNSSANPWLADEALRERRDAAFFDAEAGKVALGYLDGEDVGTGGRIDRAVRAVLARLHIGR